MKHLRHFRFLSTTVWINIVSVLFQKTYHLRVMYLNIMWKLLLKRRNTWRMLWVLSYITLSRQYQIEWISIPDSSAGLEMTLTNITLLLIFSLFSFTYATQKNIKIFRCVIESCSGWRLNQVRQHKSSLQKRAQVPKWKKTL